MKKIWDESENQESKQHLTVRKFQSEVEQVKQYLQQQIIKINDSLKD